MKIILKKLEFRIVLLGAERIILEMLKAELQKFIRQLPRYSLFV